MGRINYKELLEKTRTEKFKLLKKDDPFFDLTKNERIWMIYFAKTRQAVKDYFPDKFEEDVFKFLFEEAYWTDPIMGKKKWSDPTSTVNITLDYYRSILDENDINWQRLQDYKRVGFRECNYSNGEGHSLCKHQSNCTLKIEGG